MTALKLRVLCGLPVDPKELISEYWQAIYLDGKPEKGERKVSDDLIILAVEIMQA